MALCPHCQQTLPEPSPATCPHCGGVLDASVPAATPGAPWERRESLGFFTALVETVRESLFSPTEFFRKLSPRGGIGAPLLFAVIVGYVGQLVANLYQLILHLVVGGFGREAAGMPPPVRHLLEYAQGFGGFLVALLLGWLFVAIFLFIWSGIVHLLLLLFGGARRDFEATFRVVAYSESALLFQIVPFCGGLIALVYSLILNIIGLSEVHGIGKGKAAAAVLVPLLLCCCCVAAVLLLAFGAGAGLARSMR